MFFGLMIVAQITGGPPVFADSAPVTAEVVRTLSILVSLPESKKRIVTVITDEAQKLYEKYQKPVYQIRVIDLASGKKSVIGSGFQFTNRGHIATNFHVISDAVHEPKRFKIEFLRFDGTIGDVKVEAIDVVHDLAILKSDDKYEPFLEFGASEFPKGARIFSMGNPHDLGMSIVEGTYNGLLEKSLYRKIHFSGSLNGGMSGGPAIDNKGRVIGINVATSGNQLSFLVPVEYLKDLYATIKDAPKTDQPVPEWNTVIEDQLVQNQSALINSLIDASWEVLLIGSATVPGEMTNLFKCWGDSKNADEELYQWASLRCSSQDDIFIANDLRTGRVIYNYVWVQSKGLNPFRFYRVLEYWFSQPFHFDNAKEDDVRNFKCETDFVRIGGENWKSILCARQYKNSPRLYDVNLNMASLDHYKKGLLIEMVALGVTQEKAQALVRKFMGGIKWTK
jgi:serine protease Do